MLMCFLFRFGKPVVMDMMDKPIMYDTMEMKMEDVSPGLLASVMNKTILKEDVWVYKSQQNIIALQSNILAFTYSCSFQQTQNMCITK